MEGKTMTKAFSYLRTSGDDGKEKAGLPVQREGCAVLAKQKGFKIVQEFADDGVSGKYSDARPSFWQTTYRCTAREWSKDGTVL